MTAILILIEGFVMCFLLLLVCVVGIANGPAGLVVLYEQDVQDRAIELGLTTKKKDQKKFYYLMHYDVFAGIYLGSLYGILYQRSKGLFRRLLADDRDPFDTRLV